MRKLHDLKAMLSTETQLSRLDCMRIKGGEGGDEDKRRDRGTEAAISLAGVVTVDIGGFNGG